MAVASSNLTSAVVNMGKKDKLYTFADHTASITGVAWLSEDRLITSSNCKTVSEWSVSDQKCFNTPEYASEIIDIQDGCANAPKSVEIVSVSLHPQINILHIPN